MNTPSLTYASPDDSLLRAGLIRAIEALTGRRHLERLYARTAPLESDTFFWASAIDQLDVTPQYAPDRLEAVPRSGPLVVVANHPYGVLDGLVLCHLVSRVRPDFRVLVNSVLCRDDRIDIHTLPVDFQDTAAARRTNRRTIRTALATLNGEGAVLVFPAGGIATAPTPFGRAEDLPWKPLAATLVQSTEATVAPMYVAGQASRLFQCASQVSQTLRLSLVIREVVRNVGDTVPVRIGAPRAYDALPHPDDRAALTQHLRALTLSLGDTPRTSGEGTSSARNEY